VLSYHSIIHYHSHPQKPTLDREELAHYRPVEPIRKMWTELIKIDINGEPTVACQWTRRWQLMMMIRNIQNHRKRCKISFHFHWASVYK